MVEEEGEDRDKQEMEQSLQGLFNLRRPQTPATEDHQEAASVNA